MSVDRCVCFDVTFATLHEAAKSDHLDFDGLQEQFSCGRGCGLCVPYVRAMLTTGQTSFRVDEIPAVSTNADGSVS